MKTVSFTGSRASFVVFSMSLSVAPQPAIKRRTLFGVIGAAASVNPASR